MSSIFTSTRPMRMFVFGLLPVAVIIAATVAGMIAMQAGQKKPERNDEQDKGLVVFATQAERSDITLSVSAQGETRPRSQITLTPQVTGRITYVSPNFIDGGYFEQGEVLLRIDDADYRLAVTRAEGQVAQARSALERERAESEIARRDWEELGEGPASSLTLREPQLAEARAQLAAAEASLADARLALERTEIVAPFTGRVRQKSADIGQYVSPGSSGSLGSIYATDIFEIRLPLTDQELALVGLPVAFSAESIESGAPVTLKGRVSGAEREWEGRIMRTDSVIDPRTRVIYAVAEVRDPFGEGSANGVPLPVGLFVTAEVAGRTIENAVELPRQALRGTSQVYIANLDGTLAIRDVEVANTDRKSVIVASGVEAGDYVITSALLSAQEDMRIDVYDAETNELLFPIPEENEEGEQDGEHAESDEDADEDDDSEQVLVEASSQNDGDG